MGKIINLYEIKNFGEEQKNIVENKLERKSKIILTNDEAFVLINSYFDIIEIYCDDIRNEIRTPEEIQSYKELIENYKKLIEKLKKQLKKAKAYNEITLNYSAYDIYYAVGALERFIDLFENRNYETLEDFYKIYIHLHTTFKKLDINRMKIYAPLLLYSQAIQESEEWSVDEDTRLRNEEIYKKDFGRMLFIEENQTIVDGDLKKYYYVKHPTKEVKKILKQMSLGCKAKNISKSEVNHGFKNNANTYYFSKGWRVYLKSQEELGIFADFDHEVITLNDRAKENSRVYENYIIIETRYEEVLENLLEVNVSQLAK